MAGLRLNVLRLITMKIIRLLAICILCITTSQAIAQEWLDLYNQSIADYESYNLDGARMVKGCSKGCEESYCCDFCKHYNFNGDRKGRYLYIGYCSLYKKKSEPWDGCKRFYCEFIEE